MKRIAIVGGGVSGLTAAYELELARRSGAALDWHLYEASPRLGGIIETIRIPTPAGEYILEGGPDAWVSEKPWARDLAIELGLEGDLIPSNDATRKTWVYLPFGHGKPACLQPIPDRMRLMVPDGPGALPGLDTSPLFSPAARQAFHDELTRAAELRASALDRSGNAHADESVAMFVRRHFGPEVLASLAAPLLSGVFGGDVERLSVRAVMPQFVALEREHGSLIAGLGARPKPATSPAVFTTLRRGMASLTEALVANLPAERLHLDTSIRGLWPTSEGWKLDLNLDAPISPRPRLHNTPPPADHLILATSLHSTRRLLQPYSVEAASLLPAEASSALLVAFAWPAETAETFTIPSGFGFLVPPSPGREPQLLAATFVDQKFPHRAPAGARIVRAFFGSDAFQHFHHSPDASIAATALTQLRAILEPEYGPLPDPDPGLTTIRRWPGSLPQYEVGHLDRIARLEALVAETPGLHLLGNSYHGVGIPDLIRDARGLARSLAG